MTLGLVGKKRGMTRVFTESGESIPVTVIEVEPNRVTQIKTKKMEGYSAIQVTAGAKKVSRLNSPQKGHFAKAGVEAGEGLWEFRLENDQQADEYQLGSELCVSHFEVGHRVDVRGVSKGKGFAGAVKRWNFKTQDATHGNSLSHRAPGSIGQNQTPGRVFKGKKMAGQYGNKKITVQGLSVVKVLEDKNLILVKGAVPGFSGSYLVVTQSVKS